MGNPKATSKNATQPRMLARASAAPRAFCRNTSVAYMPGMGPNARAKSVMKMRILVMHKYEKMVLTYFEKKKKHKLKF